MPTSFLFVTCQVGAEKCVKVELARRWPTFRFAYSRPGFLTFKLPPDHGLADDFDLESVFARAYGFSLGKAAAPADDASVEAFTPNSPLKKSATAGLSSSELKKSRENTAGQASSGTQTIGIPLLQQAAKLVAGVWQQCKGRTVQRIHVWEPDRAEPGEHGYQPSMTEAARDVHRRLVEACPSPKSLAKTAPDLMQPAKVGETVLDCVLVSPKEWWVGFHRVHSMPSRLPGGLMSLELPPEAVSRAWLKMEEGLRWSQLPMRPGSRVAEIGSAPGGASQALLARGMAVTGVDPAAMSPVVLAHPQFTHIRRRSTQVRRREFRKIRWLTADMNVAPEYTLDAVEAIVTHPEVKIRGLLLTLKLPDWKLAARIPDYLDRIRCWGYNQVRARQLQYDRHEICVAALRAPR